MAFAQLLQGYSALRSLSGGRRAGAAGAALSRFSRDRLRELGPIGTDLSRRGDQLWQRYQERAPGLEDAIIDAAKMGTNENTEAGAALSDVRQQSALARDAAMRGRARYGIDPSSGAAVVADRGAGLEEARLAVSSMNRARRTARDDKLGRSAIALNAVRPNAQLALAHETAGAATLGDAARIGSGMAADANEMARQAGAAAAPGLDSIAGWLDKKFFPKG